MLQIDILIRARGTTMNRDRTELTFTLLAGIGIGAAAMYFLDPGRGGRRRALLGDQADKATRKLRREAREAASDMRNRAKGVFAEARGRLRWETVSDEQLVARVRAELGHHVEHTRGIRVAADDGTVTLRGPVLAEELACVVNAIERVPGVKQVDNQLYTRAPEWASATDGAAVAP